MKLRLSTLVCIGLLALLSACGGGGSSSGGNNPPPVDTTPDGFTFTAQGGVNPAAAITSNEITISGINANATVSVSGGEYSINDGAFTSAAGAVSNNQRVRVRMTSSAQFTTAASATLTIGGVGGTFTTTTRAADTTPAAFQFARAANAARSAVITSGSVTITDIEVAVPVTISNGEYSINGGAYTTAAGTVVAGQTITVRTTSGATWSKVSVVRLTVGGVSGDFEITTEVPAYIPDNMAFDGDDVVFLQSNANALVFRWSISGARYLDAYAFGQGALMPTKMAYSPAHKRLYFGYPSGEIRYLSCAAANPVETPFATVPLAVNGLAAVGNYVMAQDASGAWATHYVIDNTGTVTDWAEWNYYSREYAWDATTSRVYFFRDDTSPDDLHYEVIDQATGQISSAGETPYHGSYNIVPPIRVSANGAYVLLGSGDLYNQNGLTWAGSLGGQLADARWMGNGSIVALTSSGNQTTLRRLSAGKVTLELLSVAGQQPRVFGSDTAMVVVTVNNGTVQFRGYVPSDDSDGDGVSNTQDAFPIDPAASVDSDHDGYPDAWNAGRTQADSTSGLVLDAFPNDAACWLAAHGSGGVCNYGATIPDYTPDQVAQNGDVVYLLSSANKRIYRWSIATGQYLNPYVVGINQGFNVVTPTRMAFSPAHNRLYVGYETGQIQYLDTTSNSAAEVPFANTAMAVTGLAAVGNFVLAQDHSGAWATHYIFSGSGALTASADWNYYSREYAWDPVTSRVYFFRDDTSPDDLHYEVIDQTNGTITSAGETPYHGSYNIIPPIRVSPDGQHVLLGSGDLYAQATLNWEGALGGQVADARWMANGSLVTLTTTTNQTSLRRLGAGNLNTLEQLTYTGQALRVVGSDTKMAVLVLNNGTVQFYSYVPSDDSDGDGVLNTQDAFPLDRAASVDTDHDGYPDAWNAGRSQADSTTGLVLDAFPNDAACWLPAHGSGGVCNYGATIPNYVPDRVAQNGDVVYLLSSANKRVYRWSISTGQYLNPYVVGINQGFSTIAPTTMAFSVAHHRLYLGYDTGAIRSIDVNASGAEVPFSNTAMAVRGLASVGNYVLAQDGSGAWATHYIIDSGGTITASAEWNYYSRDYDWDAVNSRIYFFRDDTSPDDLHYEVIDQSNGHITGSGETPYHGSYNIIPPIRVSPNGQHVLLGSGDLYAAPALTWEGSLGAQIADGRWLANGSLVTLTTASNQTVLRRHAAANLAVIEQRTFAGAALRVVGTDSAMVVIVNDNGTVKFTSYVPSDDSDNDGVSNTADAFPLDRAASVDTDRDGYPDAWNPGRSQADSTTGLVLDAFPNDAACWLPAHGSGGVCNYGATIPNYVADRIAQNGDVIYLLSAANKRVYRRSISTGQYLNPYIVGINQGFSTIAPTKMTFSAAQNRLYLGYDTGAIRYLDVTAGSPVETPFANTAMALQALASVGNYVLAEDGSGAWATHYVFNAAGVLADSAEWNYISDENTWDPVTSRVYYFSYSSGGSLRYEVINQATGEISSSGEAPYNGSRGTAPPIRVSADGAHVLLGTGDLYAQNGLAWEGSLGGAIADARWFANGSLAALTTDGNQTTLRRFGAGNLATLEQLTYAGQALRVVGSDAAMVVIAINNGTTQFYNYVPNDDSDGDGVTNSLDAFPLDRAASVDTDHDGYPNAWNAGRSQADSTTGLTLDAFPNDAACWLAAHGSGGVCNYGATIPNYIPDAVTQQGDVVYLLSSANKRVYRRSISTNQYLNPYIVGLNLGFSTVAPTKMAFSAAQGRLYLGYDSGKIRYIDVNAGPAETDFTTVGSTLNGLTAAGNFLLAHADGHYVINSAGTILTHGGGAYGGYSRDYAWDPVTSRIYYFRDCCSPDDLHYDVINAVSGLITESGETPYHGDFIIAPPIRVTVDGQHVLLGSGDIYAQNGLTWEKSLGSAPADARWFADGSLVTLTTAGSQTVLRRLNSATVTTLEQLTYTGTPLRIVGTDAAMVVITVNNGTVQFYGYVPNNDSDGDGVTNTQDAFPLDRAASVDTDRDGYPDAWNAGRTQADSTTGLTLDAFPNDSACWLASHGSGGVCNYGATIPNYSPDQVVSQGDVVYLLSSANNRVYRWSIATGQYLNPYVVGISQGLSTVAPTKMAFSSAHGRLYLAYPSGAIRYIDVNGSPAEVDFGATAMSIWGLTSAGNFLLAHSDGHYVFNSAGTLLSHGAGAYGAHSSDYAWDPVSSRVYYFRDCCTPNDLHYDKIDATGLITESGETPYHGDYNYAPPIRVSQDGQRVIVGTGDIYARDGLIWLASLGKPISDARWTSDLLVDVDSTDRVELRDPNTRAVLAFYQYLGTPKRVVFGTTEAYLVHVINGTVGFVRLPFYDQDADTIPRWWETLYGLSDTNAGDAAADTDGDGVTNATEYANRSNPTLADTDGDGLTDQQEIVTYHTNPANADTDGDGLSDQAEVVTWHSDPLDTDSDNDGYSDRDEVLYGGNPNDPSGVPVPLTTYSQTFEGAPNLSAWTTPATSASPWTISTTSKHGGTASYKSGVAANSQFSSTKFRGFFSNGTVSFWARVDAESCCDRLNVLVDGVVVQSIGQNSGWTNYSFPVSLGIRDVEFRYQKDFSGGAGSDAAYIDDVVFTAQ